jgi:hypothetical protein
MKYLFWAVLGALLGAVVAVGHTVVTHNTHIYTLAPDGADIDRRIADAMRLQPQVPIVVPYQPYPGAYPTPSAPLPGRGGEIICEEQPTTMYLTGTSVDCPNVTYTVQ